MNVVREVYRLTKQQSLYRKYIEDQCCSASRTHEGLHLHKDKMRTLGVSLIHLSLLRSTLVPSIKGSRNSKLLVGATYSHADSLPHISEAEIAFGIICCCLVILPRLVQHLLGIAPYNSSAKPLAERSPRTDTSSGEFKREWMHLNERNGPKELANAV